jgi:hypothetical protein
MTTAVNAFGVAIGYLMFQNGAHPGATTSAGSSPSGDRGITAALRAQVPSAEEGQSQISSELQVPCSSGNVHQSTNLLGERASMAPVDAKMGGVTILGSIPVLPASLSPVHSQHPLSGEALKRLSESLPQSVQMSASPDAFGESSWHQVGLELAGKLLLIQSRLHANIQNREGLQAFEVHSH